MTDYLSLRISAVSARCKFGTMIHEWYRCNGWQHWTLASWAESAGFYAFPYGRMSDIFGGTAGELSRFEFESLGEANRRLAAKDYGTFANNRTAQSVRNAVPLLHESGAPWTASDFWACYCGLLAPTRPMTRHD
jgi:hypothetical protein